MNFFFCNRVIPRTAVKVGLLLGACVGAVTSIPAQAQGQTAPDFGAARPLTEIVENMEGAPWSAVNRVATQQAEHTLGPNHRNIPKVVPFYAAFEGNFIPASDQTRLAIFSDDGCNVWIDGEQVWSRLERGQHLPNLGQSLHALDFDMVAGRSYAIRVEYSNTHFFGALDADGATLFAYTYNPNQERPYAEWRVGEPIRTKGIRWPYPGDRTSPGAVEPLFALLATDFDQRDAMIEGVMNSYVYSDPCSYKWEVSRGSFVDGISTGQSVKWIAPLTDGPVTIRLTVDDQNMANQPTYENGVRDDNARGFNDEPLVFTVQVMVGPPRPQ